MKTNLKSIHKRFNNWAWGSSIDAIDSNLCAYVWGTLLAIVMSPFILLGKTLFIIADHIHIDIPTISQYTKDKILSAIGHTFLVIALIGYMLTGIYLGWTDVLFWTGVFVGGVVGVFLLAMTLIHIGEWWRDGHPKKKKGKKPKTQNIFIAWLQAKKNKNCPLIEWE